LPPKFTHVSPAGGCADEQGVIVRPQIEVASFIGSPTVALLRSFKIKTIHFWITSLDASFGQPTDAKNGHLFYDAQSRHRTLFPTPNGGWDFSPDARVKSPIGVLRLVQELH